MARVRIGVAIVLCDPARTEVRALRRAVGCPSLDTQPPHITLVPPVNVRVEQLDDVMAVARSAAASIDGPLRLRIGPAETFAPVSPVLYLGVHGDDVERLCSLPPLLLHGPLQRTPVHDFVPHCTLHELADDALIAAALSSMAGFRWVVELGGFDVLQQDEDRVWRTVADFPFGTPVVRGRGGVAVDLRRSVRPSPDAEALIVASTAVTDGSPFEPWCIEARDLTGTLVAAAVGVLDDPGNLLHIDELVVDASQRRQGIGDRLLDEIVLIARARGATDVRLHTWADDWMRGWYDRRGFGVDLELPRWQRGRDMVQMSRHLTT